MAMRTRSIAPTSSARATSTWSAISPTCALESSPAGVFNVCSGEAVSLRQVLALAQELTGHSPALRVNLAFVRANEVKRLRGSSAKLHAAIGASPRRPMRETFQWMLDNR
jgi:nucleoside-diphosphate-sugar epimerase